MSRLKHAPLVEVIFELKWVFFSVNNFPDYSIFLLRIAEELRDKYPTIKPRPEPRSDHPHIVQHQFKADNAFPLIQVGPGVLTINYSDDVYFWQNFVDEINYLLVVLGKMKAEGFVNASNFSMTLQYVDFFDLKNISQLDFITNKLNLGICRSAAGGLLRPEISNINLNYEFENQMVTISLNKGHLADLSEGIGMQTSITSVDQEFDPQVMKLWADEAHRVCNLLFKHVTEPIYRTFT